MNFQLFAAIFAFILTYLSKTASSELIYTIASEANRIKNTVNDAFLIGCLDWACYKVKEFQISASNNALNCYFRNVAITFQIDFQNGSKGNSLGFLSTIHGNQIMKDKDPLSDDCQYIKR
jgi:hypothetical protein